jgi:hypothetical protein
MRFALEFEGLAETNRCDADGDPAELIGHTDNAAKC